MTRADRREDDPLAPTAHTPEVMPSEKFAGHVADRIVEILARNLGRKRRVTFVPTAGRTPIETYRALRDRSCGVVDWRRVRLVQLDEYLGLAPDDPKSLASLLTTELVRPLGLDDVVYFNDASGRLRVDPADYERNLGTIDLVVHGVGRNGHIGFNEPLSDRDSPSRIVRLAGSTLRANFSAPADRHRYRFGVTLGLTCLRRAEHSLVILTGSHKAHALHAMVERPRSVRCPASALTGLPGTRIYADAEAAMRLTNVPHTPTTVSLVPEATNLTAT